MDFSTVKWMDLFLAAINDCVPKIEVKLANSAPWIDAEVLKVVRKKERLRKRGKKSSSEYHWAIFRLHSVELKSLIKWKRKQYFKDDMKCFRIIDNTNDVQQLQSDLSNLNDWSVDHFMKFNSTKCKYLAITRKKYIVDSTYTLNGSQIMSVTTEKDLGVHVSTKLSWNNHIDVTISKANKMLSMIKRTCTNECDQKTLVILYKSLVRSRLEYASQVWSPFTKEKITALERVQRGATKFILKTDLCYPERLVKLKLLPLE
ncbi:uncharacterized protein [Montipora foliosa]|uniref:uncharacterized protein n=1 Tax=Montipora foliosa TaxID=591990 RepID=UPI0035F1CB57